MLDVYTRKKPHFYIDILMKEQTEEQLRAAMDKHNRPMRWNKTLIVGGIIILLLGAVVYFFGLPTMSMGTRGGFKTAYAVAGGILLLIAAGLVFSTGGSEKPQEVSTHEKKVKDGKQTEATRLLMLVASTGTLSYGCYLLIGMIPINFLKELGWLVALVAILWLWATPSFGTVKINTMIQILFFEMNLGNNIGPGVVLFGLPKRFFTVRTVSTIVKPVIVGKKTGDTIEPFIVDVANRVKIKIDTSFTFVISDVDRWFANKDTSERFIVKLYTGRIKEFFLDEDIVEEVQKLADEDASDTEKSSALLQYVQNLQKDKILAVATESISKDFNALGIRLVKPVITDISNYSTAVTDAYDALAELRVREQLQTLNRTTLLADADEIDKRVQSSPTYLKSIEIAQTEAGTAHQIILKGSGGGGVKPLLSIPEQDKKKKK